MTSAVARGRLYFLVMYSAKCLLSASGGSLFERRQCGPCSFRLGMTPGRAAPDEAYLPRIALFRVSSHKSGAFCGTAGHNSLIRSMLL